MLKPLNLWPALLFITILSPAVLAEERDPHGYDPVECRAVYGEGDCAEFEYEMQHCEDNFSYEECEEMRQCIEDAGYEACSIWVTI